MHSLGKSSAYPKEASKQLRQAQPDESEYIGHEYLLALRGDPVSEQFIDNDPNAHAPSAMLGVKTQTKKTLWAIVVCLL